MLIGDFHFDKVVALAPMAGITDKPFRKVCLANGADYAISEMLTAQTKLWSSPKSASRLIFDAQESPKIVQIAGAEPALLSEAAASLESRGVDIIDINLGCPAKKVCGKFAGAALLEKPKKVFEIVRAVASAVTVPVTIKMRTGPEPSTRNGVEIAGLVQEAGAQAISVHGRTRACRFLGTAEYQTIAEIKQAVDIPVLANGDITTVADALMVLEKTEADGLLIGRGAIGNPWIFAEIKAALRGDRRHAPSATQILKLFRFQLAEMHNFYGPVKGPKIARKHAKNYLSRLSISGSLAKRFNDLGSGEHQLSFVDEMLGGSISKAAIW